MPAEVPAPKASPDPETKDGSTWVGADGGTWQDYSAQDKWGGGAWRARGGADAERSQRWKQRKTSEWRNSEAAEEPAAWSRAWPDAQIQALPLGEPLLFGPAASGNVPADAAVIFLGGLGDKPSGWAAKLKPLRNKCSERWRWIHLRPPKLAQPYRNWKKEHSWGSIYSGDCLHVGSVDHEDGDADGVYRSAAEAVRQVVVSLWQEGVPRHRVLLIGFSQGASVALLTVLSHPSYFAGCAVLSGWLMPRAKALLKDAATPVPPILMCHGTADEGVGHDCAESAASHLRNAGQRLEFVSLEGGGHSINANTLHSVSGFVKTCLPDG